MKILFVVLFLVSCSQERTCGTKVKIIEIGQCNRSAYCIVKFSNGEYEHMYYPIKGQMVCP